jgi:malonyl-CoA O-methyltransferase
MKLLNVLREKLSTNDRNKELISAEKAINWIKTKRIPAAGIPHPLNNAASYQEVTGYLIPTLNNWGEKNLAQELAFWEISVQRPDGAFSAIDGVPYTFDTAQVVRGFLSVIAAVPKVEGNMRRACDYIENNISKEGKVMTFSKDALKLSDGSYLSEYGNLYVLPPLMEAGNKLQEPKYVNAPKRALNYYREKEDIVEFKSEFSTFSHFFGYMLEALIDLGEIDLAKEGLKQVIKIQRKDGSIPAYPGANWVCSTGIAQLAICLYKLGYNNPADQAMTYLEKKQNNSGGFYGSFGRGANYFPQEEISWAVKFFLDALILKNDLTGKGKHIVALDL